MAGTGTPPRPAPPGTLLQGFAWLLLCQSAGEALVRLTHAPLPGPVVGAMALWVLLAWPPARQAVGLAAEGLLAHLSLLFVPVGVGVVTHLAVLSEYGGRIALAVVLSTLLGMAAAALVMRALLPRAA